MVRDGESARSCKDGAGHRGNLGEFFQELEKRPTIARTNDALSVEDVLATSGGMQGLKDLLSTVVQDALQELIEAEVTGWGRATGNGPESAAGCGTGHGPGRCLPRRRMWR